MEKKYKRRYYIVIVSIVIMLISLFGCSHNRDDEKFNLYLTAAYSIPGPCVDASKFSRENGVEDIITDEYGRKMFTLWLPDLNFYVINGGQDYRGFVPDEALFITQKYDDERVYYYEDYCFLIVPEKGLTPEMIKAFQKMNDWNTPFQENKCSFRKNETLAESMEWMCYEKRPQDAIRKVLPDTVRTFAVVSDKSRNALYGVSTYDADSDLYKNYFVIYKGSKDSVDREQGILELTSLDFGEDLHELKIRNDWDFKNCPGW